MRILLAELYAHRENNDLWMQARLCEEGIKIDPTDKALSGHLYRVRVKRQEEENLIRFYEPILQGDYTNTEIAGNLIRLYIKCRLFEKADMLIEKANRAVNNAIYQIYKGDLALAQGKESDAKSIWYAIANKETVDHFCLFELADRFNKFGDVERAISLYERSFDVQKSPKELDA